MGAHGSSTRIDCADGLGFDVRKRLIDRLEVGGGDVEVDVPSITGAIDCDRGRSSSSDGAAGWMMVDCFQRQREWYVVARRETVLSSWRRGTAGALSAREREVAAQAAAGASLKIIASALGVGVPTVATYLRRAKSKLRAGSRAELARAMAGEQTAVAAPVAELSVGGALFRLLPAPLAPPRRWSRVLSRTEVTISMAVVHGMRNAEIARARGTSVRTVAAQVSTIMLKVAVASRAELIARAVACHKTTDGALRSRH
jgi:DNA-binding CsgD family transcriptional regulator